MNLINVPASDVENVNTSNFQKNLLSQELYQKFFLIPT